MFSNSTTVSRFSEYFRPHRYCAHRSHTGMSSTGTKNPANSCTGNKHGVRTQTRQAHTPQRRCTNADNAPSVAPAQAASSAWRLRH